MEFNLFLISFSRFVVYSSLLAFVILLALKLDNIIDAQWVIIFTPLWIWKGEMRYSWDHSRIINHTWFLLIVDRARDYWQLYW